MISPPLSGAMEDYVP